MSEGAEMPVWDIKPAPVRADSEANIAHPVLENADIEANIAHAAAHPVFDDNNSEVISLNQPLRVSTPI